jgi:uncharacterized protein (DUF697 family)
MYKRIRRLFSTEQRDEQLQKHIEDLRKRTPVPVLWLFGKTQTGKTTLIKFLTGAEEAEIGEGFRPCTRFSRQYDFPTAEAPLLTFLDTRGVDEPGYDPAEDIARFDRLAHVVIVTVKALDHAQENIIRNLKAVRDSRPHRPVVLVATCLHEAYPQQQHAVPYEAVRWDEASASGGRQAADPHPASVGRQAAEGQRSAATNSPAEASGTDAATTAADGKPAPSLPIPDRLRDSLAEQRRRFDGLYDHFIPLDITNPDEGYNDPNYGGDRLKEVLLDALPAAFRQTLIALDEATHELSDLYARHAVPHIVAYSTLAATAGAIPVPFLDMLVIPGIQTRMIYHLAHYYGQPLSGERFLELAGTLGMGIALRTATRQVVKFIPYVGSVAGAALAGASTFALGKAFCYYYSAVHRGQVPQPEDLRKYYKEQLAAAREAWKKKEAAAQ